MKGHLSADHVLLLVSVPPHLSHQQADAIREREKLKKASNGIWRAEENLLGQTHLGSGLFLCLDRSGE